MSSISARIPDEDEAALEEVSELLGEDKSTVIRKALAKGCRISASDSPSSSTNPVRSRRIRPRVSPA